MSNHIVYCIDCGQRLNATAFWTGNKRCQACAHQKNLIGKRFGRLIAIKDSGRRGYSHIIWLCQCDCGKFHFANSNNLIRGYTKSCGCLLNKHGDCKNGRVTRLYQIWADMHSRCYNPRHRSHKYYGAKGIQIYPEWKEYLNFKNWAILNGYQDFLTIDRINSSDNYEPNNCQWITKNENIRKASIKRWEGQIQCH